MAKGNAGRRGFLVIVVLAVIGAVVASQFLGPDGSFSLDVDGGSHSRAMPFERAADELRRMREQVDWHEDIVTERARIDRFAADVREEVNVKALHFTQEPRKYVEFDLQPNFRVLGPKLGKQVPACKAALQKADGSALHATLEREGSITIDVAGSPVTLDPSEL